jgi:hypothetical protein
VDPHWKGAASRYDSGDEGARRDKGKPSPPGFGSAFLLYQDLMGGEIVGTKRGIPVLFGWFSCRDHIILNGPASFIKPTD